MSTAATSTTTPTTASTQRGTEATSPVYDGPMRKALLFAVVCSIGAAALVARAGGTASSGPTYYRDVAPILDAKCASCHRLGGIAPFALTTAADAQAHAAGIVRLTKAGLMPPWMPGPDSAPIIGREKRRLTTAELQTLAALDGRRRAGRNPADRHSKPSSGPGSAAPAGRSSSRRRSAYAPHAAGGGIDDYHCFLLDPKLKQDAFVTGALIQPQRTGIVHHVILYEAAGAQAAAAEQLNAQSGGQGWSCFGGPDLPVDLAAAGAADRLGQPPWIAAWVPGHTTNALPAGTGVLLHKGAKIVMQVHYNLIAGVGPDRSRAWLRVRPATTPLIPLETHLIAAPVELPCPARRHGPQCTRTQAIQDVVDQVRRRGRVHRRRPAPPLREDARRLPARTSAAGTRSRPPATAPFSAAADDLRRRRTHAPSRARHPVVLDPGTPKEQTLLHIPAWVFHWQDVYYLEHAGQRRPRRHRPRHAAPSTTRRPTSRSSARSSSRRATSSGARARPTRCASRCCRVAPAKRLELRAHAFVDDARVGLAAGLLHHLADEEAEQALLAAAVLLGLLRVRGDDPLDHRIELGGVRDRLLRDMRVGAETGLTDLRERFVEDRARDRGARLHELRELCRRRPPTESIPVATNWFASTFAASFASAPAATTSAHSLSSPPVTSTSAS